MYQSIIIECQTLNEATNCEDCIAKKECRLKKRLEKNAENSVQATI
jgi:hypothetical protein